jgi:hypothetical protein
MEIPFTIHHWLYLLISLVGLSALISAMRSRRQADASLAWPGVQGKVIESSLKTHYSTDVDGHQTTSHTAVVRYTYSVMGKEYIGDRVAFGVKTSNRNPATEVINRYPVDKLVMVYYNPEKPEQAVLEQVSGSGWLQILAGIALVFAGIYFAIK